MDYKPQSYTWPGFRVNMQGVNLHRGDAPEFPRSVVGVGLAKRQVGNLTEYTVSPGGEWAGVEIDYSGKWIISDKSQAPLEVALASSGSWSGGGNWAGWVFGKPGAIFRLACKGNKLWILFESTGPRIVDMPPWLEAKTL